MATTETPTHTLHGLYHDVLRDANGRITWDRGWCKNTIVVDCHRLLAGFMAQPTPGISLGIQGLWVGQGSVAWDLTSPPPALSTQTSLVDPHPFLLPRNSIQMDFLNGSNVSATPTPSLQIVATLGPNLPAWPDANHASGNLREFGLVGSLNNVNILINYVTHPVIVKDPSSTLTRTIWLIF